jgi:hypothetical protein
LTPCAARDIGSAIFGELEQPRDLDVQRRGQALLHREAGWPSAALKIGYVGRLDVSGIGKVFLRPALVLAKLPDCSAEAASQVVDYRLDGGEDRR